MDQQGGSQLPLLGIDQVIKPGQVHNLGFLNQQAKLGAQQTVQALWNKLQSFPQDSPENMGAHRKLSDLSHQFKAQLTKFKQQQQAAMNQMNGGGGAGGAQQGQGMSQAQMQAAQAHAHAQAQAAQAQTQAQALHMQQQNAQAMAMNQQQQQQQANATVAANAAGQRPNQPSQFSEKVKTEVSKFNPQLPQELRSRPVEDQRRYISSQRMAYAQHMQRWEAASQGYEVFRKRAAESRASMSPEAFEKAKAEILRLKVNLDTAQKAAVQFKVTNDPVAAAEHQRNQALRVAAAAQQQQQATTAAQQEASGGNQPTMTKPEAENPNESKAQIKTEENDNENNRPGTSGQENPNANQQPIRPPPVPMQTAPVPTGGNSGQPTPLTHQAALASAQRSYSQSSAPQHGHPNQTPPSGLAREAGTSSAAAMNNNTNKHPARNVQVAPLVAAPMATSRPTLTGGQGPAGPQGQVALQKLPNVALPTETEGRVLSRNKLLELVREVTGGAIGDEPDALDPDVEEILLDIADEFVDNVASAACNLAKIRSSNTLELRDVQLIIERNYNIRVPGYASDELRTVKRIVPTPTWTQKMSAVQAAKVTGGKNDP